MVSSRSRNSHIRSLRRVTFAPIGMPSRSLNCAIDLVALRMIGFCPVIVARSRTAPSISFASRAASPTPMLTTTLTTPGICITLAKSNSCCRAARTSSLYLVLSRGVTAVLSVTAVMSEVLTRAPRHANVAAFRIDALADPGRLVVAVHDLHVRDVDRRFLGHDAAGLRTTLGGGNLGVLLDPVDALDQDPAALGVGLDDLAARALVLTSDDQDGVALLHLQAHHSTSGANEMIFMYFLSRSSRPTGPKMRVPRGSPSPLRSTAAFSSNLM